MRIKTKRFFSSLVLISLFTAVHAFDKPIVSDIRAEYANGSKINIWWKNPENTEKPITKYLVYRSTKPFTAFSDINNAFFLTQLPAGTTGCTDTLKDLNDYYYTVIAYTDEPYMVIMPSINATTKGAHVDIPVPDVSVKKSPSKEKNYPKGTLRETPLPYLDLIEGMDKNENIISEEARDKALFLGTGSPQKKEVLEPYYFEEDMISPERGDAYFLFQILSQYFVQKKYREAVTHLTRLTGTNISKDVEERAVFYLGESYYFLGNPEEAVRNFVKVQTTFPVQCNKWIANALDQMDLQTGNQ